MTEDRSNQPRVSSQIVNSAVTSSTGKWRVTGKTVLAAIVLMLITIPFFERYSYGMQVEAIAMTLVLCLGVLAIGGRRRTLITALCLAIPAVVGKWLTHAPGLGFPAEVHLIFAALTVGFIAIQFLKFIMHVRRVNADVLCTSVAAFLLIAILWAFIYQIVDRQIPGSFAVSVGPQPPPPMAGFLSVYFSLVTLCTVGFGDIVPVSDLARMCAMLEGATGVFFVAIIVSRLVSLYLVEQDRSESK